MGLANKAKGVPHWVQDHKIGAGVALTYLACLAFGAWGASTDPDTQAWIEGGAGWAALPKAAGFTFLIGSGAFTFVFLFSVTIFLFLGAGYTFVTEHLVPWVCEKSTAAGRMQARRRRNHAKKALAAKRASEALAATVKSDAQKKAAHDTFLAAAESLYQALGVNVLEAYVEARVLKDQVVEDSVKKVKI